ncbi:Uu.00g079320.m01.CDS01 [Anthostomella pinea]|uniref:Uu.00g079320.m01.CDS01 n=1 Tax=Anthostomella pinea TaxID=933095 RepID=A0AAI8VLR1_9PEZI|nr:Uu.00g079320.m01.CDS01 [Anthostomella pinea]
MPSELRVMVWKYAVLDTEIIYVNPDTQSTLDKGRYYEKWSALMFVNMQSQHVALRHFYINISVRHKKNKQSRLHLHVISEDSIVCAHGGLAQLKRIEWGINSHLIRHIMVDNACTRLQHRANVTDETKALLNLHLRIVEAAMGPLGDSNNIQKAYMFMGELSSVGRKLREEDLEPYDLWASTGKELMREEDRQIMVVKMKKTINFNGPELVWVQLKSASSAP